MVQVEKWVSPAEIKARAEEERLQREQAAGDDTAERALNQVCVSERARCRERETESEREREPREREM